MTSSSSSSTNHPLPPIHTLSVQSIQSLVGAGRLTYVEVTLACLARVSKFNHLVNAVIEINLEAVDEARRADYLANLDKTRCNGVFGIPVLIKDNVVVDGSEDLSNSGTPNLVQTRPNPILTATAGSLALVGARWRKRAGIVTRLREAGVVILGSANMSEWANFRSSTQLDGWSARGNKTHNPYDLRRNNFGPTGSSSGSGAGVACGFAVAAIGSETDGSIVMPCSRCSLVGVKPTLGLVSRSGIIPISPTQDTAGPMARDVYSAVALLDAIGGPDPADASTLHVARHIPQNGFLSLISTPLDSFPLRGLRIGFAKAHSFDSPKPDAEATAEAAALLARLTGAEVIPVEILSQDEYIQLNKLEVAKLKSEYVSAVDGFLATNLDLANTPQAVPRTFRQVTEFNAQNPLEQTYDQQILLDSLAHYDAQSSEGLATWRRAREIAGKLDDVLKQERLDCMFASTFGGCSTICGVLGYPVINVPYSFDPKSGRPFGVAFFGTAFSDATLIKVAFAFEQLVVVGTGKQTTAGPVDFEAMARNVSQGKPKL